MSAGGTTEFSRPYGTERLAARLPSSELLGYSRSCLRHWQPIPLIGGLCCTGQGTSGAQPSSTEPAAGVRKPAVPAYHGYPRYLKEISLEAQVLSATRLLRALGQEVKDQMFIDPTWARARVGVLTSGVTAATILDGVATVLGGRWYLVDGHWSLARSMSAARSVVRREQERIACGGGPNEFSRGASRKLFTFVGTLTEQQWRRMESGERLGVKDLSPQQWSLIRSSMEFEMRDPSGPHMGTPRAEALNGNVHIRLAPSGPGYGAQLKFSWPTVDPSLDGLDSVGIRVEQDGEGRWTIAASHRRHASLPGGALPGEVGHPAGQDDLRAELRLDVQIELKRGELSGLQLVQSLEAHTKASVIIAGEWIPQGLRVQRGKRSAAEIMEDVAKASRRSWKRVGGIWVLAPRPA